MILVDTSVWIDHLRTGDEELITLLTNNQVLVHPFITGELACGNLSNRGEVLKFMSDLPQSPVATDTEVLFFIDRHQLMGRGIGYIDAHLLAATTLADSALFWARDKRLVQVATDLKLAYNEQLRY